MSRNKLKDFDEIFALKELKNLAVLNIEDNPLPVNNMSRVATIGLLILKGIDQDRNSSQSLQKALTARYENIKTASWNEEENRRKAISII